MDVATLLAFTKHLKRFFHQTFCVIILALFISPLYATPRFDLSDINGTNGVFFQGGGNSIDEPGDWVSSAGDFNGDGIDDIMVGDMLGDPNGENSGQIFLIFGSDSGFPDLTPYTPVGNPFLFIQLDGVIGFRINGISSNQLVGIRFDGIGDINGDGFDDVVIGGVSVTTPEGEAYVLYGGPGPYNNTFELSSINGTNGFTLKGVNSGDVFGRFVKGLGDVNGDGLNDFTVGASHTDNTALDSGTTYVIYGRNSNFPHPFEANTINGLNGFYVNGVFEYDRIGFADSAGDFNNDGVRDIIIGSPSVSDITQSGRAYIVYGVKGFHPNPVNLSQLDGNNGAVIEGEFAGDLAGFNVRNAGDFNDDGINDVLISAYNHSSSQGAVYLLYGRDGNLPHPFELSSINGLNGIKFIGTEFSESIGGRVTGGGDFNGDGVGDILIGSQTSVTGFTGGESYLIYGTDQILGNPFLLSSLDGNNGMAFKARSQNDEASNVNFAGDFNGDGLDDVLIGAPKGVDISDFSYGTPVGHAYVVYGISDVIFVDGFEN